MYEQTLYKILPDHIKPKILKRMNRYKKWEYGYNEEHDIIIISRTGQIGDIYEIQNLKIALPLANDVHVFEENKWTRFDYPKVLKRIKTVFDWREYPEDFKEKWYDYIETYIGICGRKEGLSQLPDGKFLPPFELNCV